MPNRPSAAEAGTGKVWLEHELVALEGEALEVAMTRSNDLVAVKLR